MKLSSYLRPMSLRPLYLILFVGLMALSWLLAEQLRPHRYWSDEIGNPHYADLLPASFGDWVDLPEASAAVVNPVQAEMLDRIYSETVARTYVNRRSGRVLMLSLAYGRDQSTDTQLHTPDMCYPSQGFRVDQMVRAPLSTPWGAIKAVRMHAVMGERVEPITYFVRTGNRVTDGSLERNLTRLGLAIRGYKMDGLLFRVSEVTENPDAFEVQSRFIDQLLATLSAEDRAKFIGQTKPAEPLP
ncbi:MAG: EpsI family protein [Burkholderiales bacterium]|nr:EpsI family protein [Burkholderiales bacterium]MDE2433733.1 EpsI family protein [Burkholderiales bacterium]